MTSATTTLLTAEQFRALPDSMGPLELIRGEVVKMNVPGARHGKVCGFIAVEVGIYLRSHDIGHLMTNDSGILTDRDPDSVRGADVSFYSYERLPRGAVPAGYPDVVPEVVWEVLSPSDSSAQILTKVGEYLSAGVRVVCVVDPEERTMMNYRANGSPQLFGEGTTWTLPEIFPGLAIDVDRMPR